MRQFLDGEMGQLKAGQVHTDLIQLKLGQIEDQVKRLLDRVSWGRLRREVSYRQNIRTDQPGYKSCLTQKLRFYWIQ